MPQSLVLTPRLQTLFAKTKILCFGRYAIRVPQDAFLVWGAARFPSEITESVGGPESIRRQVAADIEKLRREDDSSVITFNGPGPIPNSWQIRYYESESARQFSLHFFNTYIDKEKLSFVLGGSVEKGESEESAAARESVRAKSLQLRNEDDIPMVPGLCIKHAFLSEDRYAAQEIVSAGIHIPSLPDVTFSISSNKNAYADYTPEEFEQTKRRELSLLERIKQAQNAQGAFYPYRTRLREGKRDVQHWHGEESLIRRKDGTHDFEWALVGTPKDVANPSEFSVQMFTKVAENTVGAAKAASLSDDEAVALWDHLLSGLKFRVKVPGAPSGSYYFPQSDTAIKGAQ